MDKAERIAYVNALAVRAKADQSVILELWSVVEDLVRMVCRRYCRAGSGNHLVDMEDLCQSAYFGFLEAIANYDPERGAFSSLLVFCIRNSCSAEIGRRGRRDPIFMASSLDEPLTDDGEPGASFVDVLPDEAAEAPFEDAIEEVFNTQLRSALDGCLGRIGEHHRDVLKTRYYENVSLAEIASTRGVSSEAARQTVKEALKKIRRDPESAAQLEEYRQEIMSVSMKKVGFRSFRETGYSSVEWAAELLVRRRMQLATGLAKLKF